MLCCVFWLVSPKCLGGKCLSGKCLHCVNASAPASTWMVRYSLNDHPTRELTLAVFTIVVVSQPDPSDVFFSHFALANDQAWLEFGIRTLCIILQSTNSWDNSQCFASMPGSPLLCSVLWADAENGWESSPAFVLAIIWRTTSLFSSAGMHFFASVASFKLTVSHMRCLSGAKHRRNSVVINWLLNYAVKVINK